MCEKLNIDYDKVVEYATLDDEARKTNEEVRSNKDWLDMKGKELFHNNSTFTYLYVWQ